MSHHVGKAAALLEALPWETKEGARGISAQEVYANTARSFDIFEMLYAQKHEYI